MKFFRAWLPTQNNQVNRFLPAANIIASEVQVENEFQCLLEEYKALREEIVFRLGAQQQLTNITAALIAASLPFASEILGRKQYVLFLIIPIVFVFLDWLILIQETYVDAIASYLNGRLAPRIEMFISENQRTPGGIWEWEVFQDSSFYSSWLRKLFFAPLGLMKYAIPILAGAASIAAYFATTSNNTYVVSPLDCTLIVVNIALVIVFITAIIVLKLPKMSIIKQRRAEIESRLETYNQ